MPEPVKLRSIEGWLRIGLLVEMLTDVVSPPTDPPTSTIDPTVGSASMPPLSVTDTTVPPEHSSFEQIHALNAASARLAAVPTNAATRAASRTPLFRVCRYICLLSSNKSDVLWPNHLVPLHPIKGQEARP